MSVTGSVNPRKDGGRSGLAVASRRPRGRVWLGDKPCKGGPSAPASGG
jgi:hypothetical protein